MFQLTAIPQSALADMPVHIRATGLPPSEMVTLRASLKDENGLQFQSKAFYRADEDGNLDLTQVPALGGDYVGVHPMGIFWSLKPEKVYEKLIKKDVINTPFEVTLELYESVKTNISDSIKSKARTTVQRWFSFPGLQRMQIREGRVRGVFFLPPGEGPFPAVIDFFVGTGGVFEFRASLLASHGFAVLALATYCFEDLPSNLLEVDVEYFEEAANFLLAHPKILGPSIGVMGTSKGAQMALTMACFLKQVGAVVSINGPEYINKPVTYRYKDQVIPYADSDFAYMYYDYMGAKIFRNCIMDPLYKNNQKSIIPVEKVQGQILFIVGENDQCFNSQLGAERNLDRLRRHGKSNGRILLYPGAGHLIEPPYLPFCYASWSPDFSFPIVWGGEPAAHVAAQEQSWAEIRKFFRQHLMGANCKL